MQKTEPGTTDQTNPFIEHKNMLAERELAKMEEKEDADIQEELDEINQQNERDVKNTGERMKRMLDEETTIDPKYGLIDPEQLDFEKAHYTITLEQEMLKLSPIERYNDLLHRLDLAVNEDNTNLQMVIAKELQKIDPKDFTNKDWTEFYKKLYYEKEKEQKDKGCNYLAHEEEEKHMLTALREATDIDLEQLKGIQNARSEINIKKPEGEEPCTDVIKKRSYADFGGEGEDQEKYAEEQLESIRQGLGGVDESKDKESRCDKENIAYNNRKRLYYLEMNIGNEEYKKLTKQQKKEKLSELKKTVEKMLDAGLDQKQQEKKLEELGWKLKLTDKIPFKKNFERVYKEKPSLEDFKKADDVIAEKCPNIFELSNFIPDDPSEMGGHPGAFINIYMPKNPDTGEECQIWGGKKWVKDSRTEYNFYEYLYKNQDIDIFKSFKKYIPLFKDEMGRCLPYQPNSIEKAKKTMHYYIPMNNLHNSVRVGTEDVNNLDIKLGFRTSFVHEKGVGGNSSGYKRDTEQSISSKVGFRLEGTSLKNNINDISPTEALESGWHETGDEGRMGPFKPVVSKKVKTPAELAEMEEEERLADTKKKGKKSLRDLDYIKKKYKLDQYQLYILNPGFIYDTFFHNTPDKYIDDFEVKLIEFENNFIKKNFEVFKTENSPAIAFIGCSIFIVNGSGGIDFKFMDFAHPYVLSWKIKNASGDKELSKNGEVCCPTNMATGEPLENTNSYDNKLGYIDTYRNKGVKFPGGKEIFKDDPDDVKFKKNITFDEWSHVFQNWMASLISFVYSSRLWINSRRNYKTHGLKKKNDKELFQSYSEYNEHFDKKDLRLSSEKDTYFWTQDKKIQMWNNLKNKSQSNLMNIPLLK